jgi:hypothetical protein
VDQAVQERARQALAAKETTTRRIGRDHQAGSFRCQQHYLEQEMRCRIEGVDMVRFIQVQGITTQQLICEGAVTRQCVGDSSKTDVLREASDSLSSAFGNL